MIKVGIIGADTPDAGELLRVLIYHPEVEIKSLLSANWAGRQVSACHHGFQGEDIVNFSDKIEPADLDILFISDDSDRGREILSQSEDYPELKIVDMSPSRINRWESLGLEYGLSEVNRKPLVRGARIAAIPSPVASLALISLYPLANSLLLNSDLDISVIAPVNVAKGIDSTSVISEITTFLKKIQNNFEGKISLRIRGVNSRRFMKVTTTVKSPLAIAEVNSIFDDIYDDHNFTFTSLSEVDSSEVEGTHKCIVSINKPGAGLLEVSSIGDCHLRGGAGDAVHVMNLFFALDEKVGLHLKPSSFGDENPDDNKTVSWFA